MKIVMSLVAFAISSAIPISAILSIFLVVRLFRTRNDKCANDGELVRPWSSRLYSASKRATLAWAAEITFSIVVYLGLGWHDSQGLPARYHFCLMVAVPIAMFAWGFVWPRVYEDGMERVKNARGPTWLSLAILLFPVFSATFALSHCLAPLLHMESVKREKDIVICADKWSSWKFRMADVAPKMIPWAATDIELVYRPCKFLSLGGHAMMRCRVSKSDLLAFAKNRGYKFQSESIERNSCQDGCGDCDFIWQVWRKYNAEAAYPTDFLSYNYRFATCGGYSFLYDVTAETLYGEWSSN